MNRFVVGTRGSALARWQTEHVNARLAAARHERGLPVVEADVRVITTQGDVNMAERLVGKLEKGFFTAELEAELLSSRIDWAVHSLKDLPTRLTAGLDLVAVLTRHEPCDLLIALPDVVDESSSSSSLPLVIGARVGTSSLRRDAMLRAFAPDVRSLPLRGNVPTRVQKLRERQYDAIVLAAAGVERLGLDLSDLVVFALDPRRFQPAPGQGAVAVEARAGDERVRALLAPLDDRDARAACGRERAFLRVLEGGCSTPFGCFVHDGRAFLGIERDGAWRTTSVALPDPGVGVQLGVDLEEGFVHATLAQLQQEPATKESTDGRPLWIRRP